ncbi:MAG: ATP-dependent helicase [Candidatus Promineifilaceae bacterium]
MEALKLRPAQAEILKYKSGRMAVSAVPGSGKTFTLSLLAAELIASGRINFELGQQVLIVTYLNAGVETFRARIRRRLDELEQPLLGFDVRTLHSLSLEIVRAANSGQSDPDSEPIVADERQTSNFLSRAIDGWIEMHPDIWYAFLPEDSPQMRARWRNISERTAKAFIRTAKNNRYLPIDIQNKLIQYGRNQDPDSQLDLPEEVNIPFVDMLTGIYARYQNILTRQGALDFDDLIWQAADLLENRPDLVETLQNRWPYVLEDEAQDSVPLQEILLTALTGPKGNWVRVGDPNQAITSTFTAAHPRFFNAFIDRPDVISRPLPNSGRCAPLIMGAANRLVHWVCDSHPVEEVRENTFRRQDILPTPPGDAQPNPPDSLSKIRIKVYKHREDEELPAIAQLAVRYAQERPEETLAILVPTNDTGHAVAEYLDGMNADYDNLLRGGSREREIAAAIYALLAVLASPLDTRALTAAHAALYDLGHPAAYFQPNQEPDPDGQPPPELTRLHAILRSVKNAESLLFPDSEEQLLSALPNGVATERDIYQIQLYTAFLRSIFDLRSLPVDDLTLALADELFIASSPVEEPTGEPLTHESDLAIAYLIANLMRNWHDLQPEWRLPELAEQLANVAEGRSPLPFAGPADFGYEPEPGRITLTTQHSAKGLEWDAVFLIGIDGRWIPGSLEAPFIGVHDFLGGDPTAEATAQLNHLMQGNSGLFDGRTATESTHIEVISERLRLLYVGITRARRYLHLSRSRATRRYNKEHESEPATVMAVLYQYLQERSGSEP